MASGSMTAVLWGTWAWLLVAGCWLEQWGVSFNGITAGQGNLCLLCCVLLVHRYDQLHSNRFFTFRDYYEAGEEPEFVHMPSGTVGDAERTPHRTVVWAISSP